MLVVSCEKLEFLLKFQRYESYKITVEDATEMKILDDVASKFTEMKMKYSLNVVVENGLYQHSIEVFRLLQNKNKNNILTVHLSILNLQKSTFLSSVGTFVVKAFLAGFMAYLMTALLTDFVK